MSLFCRHKRENRIYTKVLNKANTRLSKELDLRKFVLRQRLQTAAIMGLLSGRQKSYIDRISQLVIRESSDLDETSSDRELSDWQRDEMDYAKRMAQSSNIIDKRLIGIYRLRKAH